MTQLDEHRFNRREWMVQRIGWGAMALSILLALCGLFGEGPLSTTSTGIAPQATIAYERFVHLETATTLSVTPAAIREAGELHIQVDGAFMETYRIVSIVPDPSQSFATANGYDFTFLVADSPVPVVFHIRPERLGRRSSIFRIDSAMPLSVRQFIYP
jgi:hypothetical protein